MYSNNSSLVNQFGGLDTNYNVVYVAYTNYLDSDNPGPWQSRRILDFDNPVTDYFSFALNSDLPTIEIDGDEVPLINFINPAENILLGGISLAENFYNAELFEYRWSWDRWKLVNITTIDNVGTLASSDNTLLRVYLKPNNFKRNTLYVYQFNPNPDSHFSMYSQPFFVKGANTVITNGALDTSATFSGDYYNNYNNDTNTEEIINNTNDNSQVDNIIAENLSGDVNDFAAKVGYSAIQNPFIHVIEFLLNGICNTVLGSGDVTLDFSFRGVNWVLHSSDLTTPTNALTTFMGVLLSALYVFAFYKYGFHVYEKLQEGDINSVINSSHDDNNWRYM